MTFAVHVYLYVYDWSVIRSGLPALARGALYTLEISAVSIALASLVGLPVALLRMSRFKPASVLASVYIQVFRSLSIYLYILFIFFGLPAVTGIQPGPFGAAVISLVLLNSAYVAEIYRGAFQAIETGQLEAAASLGMAPTWTLLSVALPQALRVSTPSLVNDFTLIVKDSSIVAVIGAYDLTYSTQQLVNFYHRSFEFYTVTGLIYVAIVVAVSWLARGLERRLSRHLA